MSRLADEKRVGKGKGNGSRGSVNNQSRLSRFQSAKEKPAQVAEWGTADPRWIAACVVASTLQGMEIAFSLSSDGGAHCVKLYDFKSGERAVLWFNGDADLDAELEKVYNTLLVE